MQLIIEKIVKYYDQYAGIKMNIVREKQSCNLDLLIFEVEGRLELAKIKKFVDDGEIDAHLGIQNINVESYFERGLSNAVVFEIPKETRETILFKDILEKEETKARIKDMELPFYLMRNIRGDDVFMDLADAPHILVAGTTGSGKSVFLNSLLISLVRFANDFDLVIIDPKKVEFSVFKKLKFLQSPILDNPDKIDAILEKMVAEMENRYTLLEAQEVKDLKGYNLEVDESNRLNRIVILIDEFAEISMEEKNNGTNIVHNITRLAQKGRACGIHLVLSTQKPNVKIIDSVLKSNLPTRVAFRVLSHNDSMIIIDSPDAKRLLGKGDMICVSSLNDDMRGQSAFLNDNDIKPLIKEYESDLDSREIKQSFITKKPDVKLENANDETDDSNETDDNIFSKYWQFPAAKINEITSSTDRTALKKAIDTNDLESIAYVLKKHKALYFATLKFGRGNNAYEERVIENIFFALREQIEETKEHAKAIFASASPEMKLDLLKANYKLPYPIIKAREWGELDLLKYFDINKKDEDGNTALMVACINNDYELAKLLLEHGADINMQDSDGWTALIFACTNKEYALLKFLLENGADVDIKNNEGITALIRTCRRNDYDIAKLLLEHGADVNIKINNGFTALDIAKSTAYYELIELLESYKKI